MVSLSELETLLGWCLAINVGIMIFQFVIVLSLKSFVTSHHAKLFGLDETAVRQEHFRCFSIYKILVIIFNIAPYLALKIM